VLKRLGRKKLLESLGLDLRMRSLERRRMSPISLSVIGSFSSPARRADRSRTTQLLLLVELVQARPDQLLEEEAKKSSSGAGTDSCSSLSARWKS